MSPITSEPNGSLETCEVFRSLAGETSHVGRPAFFVRLSGCNLRCRWCDTPKAWNPGMPVAVDRLLELAGTGKQRLVVITGGEPLLQVGTVGLCRRLLEQGREVLVETNGSLDITGLPEGAHVMMDIKTPSSGQNKAMDLDNLDRLRTGDQLKLVVADRFDFDWALGLLDARRIPGEVPVLFSPLAKSMDPARLADWILQSNREIRMQVQLHKILWPDGAEAQPILDAYRQIQ